MRWRVIVKMSFTNDRNSSLRNSVDQCLKRCGIKPSTTTAATWEGKAVSAVDAANQLETVFALLSHPGKIGLGRGRLDHLWSYIDRAKTPKPSSPAA